MLARLPPTLDLTQPPLDLVSARRVPGAGAASGAVDESAPAPSRPRPFLDERRRTLDSQSWKHFDARPVAPVLGAEVNGVDLEASVPDDVIAELREALLAYKVLFFRDQAVTSEQQLDFASLFGPLDEHPFIPASDESPEIVRFEKGEDVAGVENVWDSDVSWREVPSLGSVLRALEVPDLGGDTLFSHMEAAYDGLDDETRNRADGLVAVHDFVNSFGAAIGDRPR